MRLQGLRFELGVKLAAKKPRVVLQLTNLDIHFIRSLPGQAQTVFGKDGLVLPIEFIAVSVALADHRSSVCRPRETSFGQHAVIGAETHRAAEFVNPFQLAKFVYDAVRSVLIEFARMGAFEAGHIARVFDHHGLHTEADTKIGDLVLSRVPYGGDHTLDPALAETSWDENPVVSLESLNTAGPGEALRLNPVDVDLQMVSQTAMQQGFL